MFKNLRLAWTVAFIAVVVAVTMTVRADRLQKKADTAQQTLDSQERLRRFAQDFQPARFVSATDTSVTYQIPHQIEFDDRTFVQYTDVTATYDSELEVFGAVGEGTTRERLAAISQGADISVDVSNDGVDGFPTILGLYVAP